MALLHLTVRTGPSTLDAVPYALYLWTYASSVLALAAFFGLPAAALWGGLGMGAVAVPLAWSLRRPVTPMSRWARALVATGSALAAAGTVHAAVNAVLLRRPDPAARPGPERVSVLVPMRDEATRVSGLPGRGAGPGRRGRGARPRRRLDRRHRASIARARAGARVLTGRPLPPGWLGKPHACQQLADAADPAADVLVFLDADVRLEPGAIAATVALLGDRDLVCPYPRQVAGSAAERLVQPLLQWSWLTFLPLRLAERSPRPSLSAANGQLLAVRRAAYDRAGGHAAVRADVVEDVALLRAVKRAGGRGGVADGTALADCRMYAAGRSCATATPSRCGRRSGHRPARPGSPPCSRSATWCRRWAHCSARKRV